MKKNLKPTNPSTKSRRQADIFRVEQLRKTLHLSDHQSTRTKRAKQKKLVDLNNESQLAEVLDDRFVKFDPTPENSGVDDFDWLFAEEADSSSVPETSPPQLPEVDSRYKHIFNAESLKKAWAGKPNQTDNGFELIVKSQPSRELKLATTSILNDVKILHVEFPNFHEAVEQIEAHLSLNILTEMPIKLPAINLQGEPGIGKTQFVRRLAEVLQLEFFDLNIGSMSGKFELVGGHSTYRDATYGEVARLMLGQGETANPLFLLDELCLVKATNGENLYHPLYGLFDAKQSRCFKDVFLGIELDLSSVNFITTTNEFSRLPAAIKSRLTNISISAPNRQQMTSIVESIFQELLVEFGLEEHLKSGLCMDIIQALTKYPPRDVRQHLHYACGLAARRIINDDFTNRTLLMADLPISLRENHSSDSDTVSVLQTQTLQ
jgi:hypothetical protein